MSVICCTISRPGYEMKMTRCEGCLKELEFYKLFWYNVWILLIIYIKDSTQRDRKYISLYKKNEQADILLS
jgi:hypothetical protein